MSEAHARGGPRLSIPLLGMAMLASAAAVAYLGLLLADDRCLDAGGRVVVSGLDRVCEGGGASAMQPLTWTARVLGGLVWAAASVALYAAMARFVRSGRPAG
jgi:hypothetical protein